MKGNNGFTNWGNVFGKLVQKNWKLLSQNIYTHIYGYRFNGHSQRNLYQCRFLFPLPSLLFPSLSFVWVAAWVSMERPSQSRHLIGREQERRTRGGGGWRRGVASRRHWITSAHSDPKWVSSKCSATKLFFFVGVGSADETTTDVRVVVDAASSRRRLKSRLLSEQIKLGLRREPCQVLLLDTHSCSSLLSHPLSLSAPSSLSALQLNSVEKATRARLVSILKQCKHFILKS